MSSLADLVFESQSSVTSECVKPVARCLVPSCRRICPPDRSLSLCLFDTHTIATLFPFDVRHESEPISEIYQYLFPLPMFL